jgi:Cu-processing system ATP-binding protein
MPDAVIECENLTKRFGHFTAVDHVSFSVSKGSIFGFLGPNGSGKTTMIKCLLGMVLPDSGRILVDGKPVIKEWEYRSKIGYMPQISRFPENMKVRQLFALMRDIRKATKPMI